MADVCGFRDNYFFLSNFSPSQISIYGRVFPTVENAFQYAKTKDPVWQNKIANAKLASEAKFLGRKCPLRSDWDQVKLAIMEELIFLKFKDPYLKELLLQTGDDYLEETNTWGDSFWGVISSGGQNHLGKILMKVRDFYRKEI